MESTTCAPGAKTVIYDCLVSSELITEMAMRVRRTYDEVVVSDLDAER